MTFLTQDQTDEIENVGFGFIEGTELQMIYMF